MESFVIYIWKIRGNKYDIIKTKQKNAFPPAVWQLFKYASNHSSPELGSGEKRDTGITT